MKKIMEKQTTAGYLYVSRPAGPVREYGSGIKEKEK